MRTLGALHCVAVVWRLPQTNAIAVHAMGRQIAGANEVRMVSALVPAARVYALPERPPSGRWPALAWTHTRILCALIGRPLGGLAEASSSSRAAWRCYWLLYDPLRGLRLCAALPLCGSQLCIVSDAEDGAFLSNSLGFCSPQSASLRAPERQVVMCPRAHALAMHPDGSSTSVVRATGAGCPTQRRRPNAPCVARRLPRGCRRSAVGCVARQLDAAKCGRICDGPYGHSDSRLGRPVCL